MSKTLGKARYATIHAELQLIEQHLDDMHAMTHLLLAAALVRDGHAKDWKAAMRLAEDLDAVRLLYPLEDKPDAVSDAG